MFLLKVCQALEQHRVRYALVGGYAVALHGAVRGTVDIDLVVAWDIEQLSAVEGCLNAMGLISRLPVDARQVHQFRDEYIHNRHLIAWNFYNPKDMSQQVDIVINCDLGNKKVIRKEIDGLKVRVLNKTDLIKMKQAAGRPQDIEDVKSLQAIR